MWTQPHASRIGVVPRRPSRPIETVPRFLLIREEAAASLGMSVKTFRRRVQPFIKIVRQGQLVLISPRELERWVRESDRWA